jgi:hypothetical protein
MMELKAGLNDLNNDGRVHISEMCAIVAVNGGGLGAFEKLFVIDVDFSVAVTAEVKVFALFGYPPPPPYPYSFPLMRGSEVETKKGNKKEEEVVDNFVDMTPFGIKLGSTHSIPSTSRPTHIQI